MKVYAVMYNNGEEWGDNYECIIGMYSDETKAKLKIIEKGYTQKKKGHGDNVYYVRPKIDKCEYGVGLYEDNSKCDTCKDSCVLLDQEYDNSYMFVTIYEVK